MSKSEFIKRLQDKTSYSEEQCTLVITILEKYFIVGKNNKKKIINALVLNSFSENDAETIYDIAISIIMTEIKQKIKHPFKKKD